MRLVVEINLDNEAMETAAEAGAAINRSLIRCSASAIDPLVMAEFGSVLDANGNTVGSWRVEP